MVADLMVPVLQQTGTRFPSVLIFYVLLLVVFYLLLIRPQQVRERKRRDMLGKLKKGDRVVTVGGLHATIHDVDQDMLVLDLGSNLRVKADRGAVSYLRSRKAEPAPPAVVSETPPKA